MLKSWQLDILGFDGKNSSSDDIRFTLQKKKEKQEKKFKCDINNDLIKHLKDS